MWMAATWVGARRRRRGQQKRSETKMAGWLHRILTMLRYFFLWACLYLLSCVYVFAYVHGFMHACVCVYELIIIIIIYRLLARVVGAP